MPTRLRSLTVLAFLVLGLVSHRPAVAGGPIVSGETMAGVLTNPTYSESWTFSATVDDRIVIAAVTISGSVNTNIILYPPVGPAIITTTNDRVDLALPQTGSYTIEVQDVGLNDAGLYVLGLMNITAGPHTSAGDLDGAPIGSNEVTSGTIGGTSDFDAFTFSGTNGDRVIVNCVATGGAGYNTYFFLYPPGGGPALVSSFGDTFDAQLNATGTWTILVEDANEDTAGSYALSFLNVTAGPHTTIGDLNGGGIVSGEKYSGSFDHGVDLDAWTFSGTIGDRVIVLDIPTGGGSQNTTIAVYPPGGGASILNNGNDRFDFALPQSGTYTMVMTEVGFDHTGAYALAMLNVTAGPHTNPGDLDGAAIGSGDVTGGATSAPADMDAYTFTASNGDRVMIDCVATAGAGYNTHFFLYGPDGAAALSSSFGDNFDVQLNATGTWTIVVEDASDDTAGSYALSLLNITSGPHTTGSDPDGSAIVSGSIYSGTFNQGVDMDAYTFAATAGDRIVMLDLPNPVASHNTQMAVYPPGGVANVLNTGNDRNEIVAAQTGTYTLVLHDNGFDHTGSYTVAIMNITSGPHTSGGDADGAAIVSAQVTGGTTSAVGDIDVFTFSGLAGDRVLIDGVATGGAGYNARMFLYGPAGAAALSSTFGDLLDVQLNATGAWSILIEDAENDTGGTYALSLLNVTSGPHTSGGDLDGGAIASNQIKSGQFHQGVDFDAFQFSGTVDQRVLIAGVATPAASHNTMIYLYPPAGGAAVVSGTANDRVDFRLTSTGTHTIVVHDVDYNHTGSYTVSYLNVTAGAYVDGADANGGPIASNQILSAASSGPGDFDAYTFTGTNGHRLLMSAVATGGAGYNTMMRLYPPNGGASATSTFGDRLEFKLNATGTWVLVIEDDTNELAGNYNVSILDVTSGAYTGFGETDGGPMLVGPPLAGSSYAVSDFDGFLFTGYTGQNAALSAVVTSGAMNTYISLYPPDGGIPLTQTANDNVNVALTMDGVYTVVVEDLGQDHTGTYGVSVNLSNGPTPVGKTPPAEVALMPAYPSPFNATTTLDFALPGASRVHMRVYDVRGALVRSIMNENRGAGFHSASWDGRDDHGVRAASGVYYVRFDAGGTSIRQKLVLVR